MPEPLIIDFSRFNYEFSINQLEYEAKNKIYLKPTVDFIKDWFENKPILSFNTSGSTGSSKQIFFEKEQVLYSAEATGSFFNLQKEDNVLICLNTEFTGGRMMLARAIHLKLTAYIYDPSGFQIPENPDSEFKLTSFVPAHIFKILEEEKTNLLEYHKNIIIGGASVSKEIIARIKDIKNTSVYESFGMTETLGHFALKKLNSSNPENFKILPGVEIRLNNNSCLLIKSPATKNKWIETRDIAELISTTEFKWKGRADNVINSGGIKINPEEIEELIYQLMKKYAFQRYYITWQEDSKLGQKLVLVAEGTGDDFTLLKEIKNNLPPYHSPSKVIFVKKIEETSSGKIIRTRNF